MSESNFVDEAAKIAGIGVSGGGGFYIMRWVWTQLTGRLDRRQAIIDRQEERADREWEKIRNSLESRLAAIERQNEALRFSFHHVAGALIRLDPQNPALAQAEQILAQAFPLDFRILAAQAEVSVSADHALGG